MGLVVCMGNGVNEEDALILSARVGCPLADEPGDDLTLMTDGSGLSLLGHGLKFQGDFERMIPRITNGRLSHEMLVHVAKPKRPGLIAIDATAGMGEDALLLAACGYEVTLYEKNAVIAELLRDTMVRAQKSDVLKQIVGRMRLVEGDSVELMHEQFERADLVYLDPMFPKRQKSGLINKKLQLMQRLEMPCGNEKDMLDAAMSLHPQKIIIKRPLKGAYLADTKPSYSVKGKAIRYDCLAFPNAD